MKIQTKITLLFTLVCTSIIVALSFAIYYFTYQNASQDFYTRLELRATIAAKANLQQNRDTTAFRQIRLQHMKRLPEEREFIIRTDTLARISKSPLYSQMPVLFFDEIRRNGRASYRDNLDFYQGILYRNGSNAYLIVVAAQNGSLKDFIRSLRHILIIAGVICLILVFSAGLIFSRQIMAPVRSISRQVQRITATSLHKRLTLHAGRDEIASLTEIFNDLLGRLETAFETQNNFVSNASHELNTPLTSIIGEADYALSKPRSAHEYQQSLAVIMQQGEKLQHITESLVQLARAGFHENLTMQRLGIAELVHNAVQNVHNVYGNCTIQVDKGLHPADPRLLQTQGNEQLLELAVSNVLMNACKYSGSQPVTVALAVSAAFVLIIVKDNGIGIPEADLKHIFDPFFRASNVRTIHGYGIGLPLTQNILRLHKGSIEIHSHLNKGTEVIIRLPLL